LLSLQRCNHILWTAYNHHSVSRRSSLVRFWCWRQLLERSEALHWDTTIPLYILNIFQCPTSQKFSDVVVGKFLTSCHISNFLHIIPFHLLHLWGEQGTPVSCSSVLSIIPFLVVNIHPTAVSSTFKRLTLCMLITYVYARQSSCLWGK
jgi:hypothetical protein